LAVDLRIGVEALARLEAEAALGDQPLQDPGRSEALAVRLFVFLHPLEDGVEALEVGLPEGREETPPRVEAGAGHHPEVDLADGADALLEHEAGLPEGLQHQQVRELLAIRLRVTLDVGFTVRVEAVASGLGAELAVGHQLLHALVDVEAV